MQLKYVSRKIPFISLLIYIWVNINLTIFHLLLKLVSISFVNFAILEVSSQNLLLLYLQMPLYIPALIIVIVFFTVCQSTQLIAYKKYKTQLLVLLLVPLVHHISLQFSNLYIGYQFNTVLTLNCVVLLIVLSH